MAVHSLAIETTSHQGAITLGRDETVLASAELPRRRRHNIELMPTIEALFQAHGLGRGDLEQVYVSLGPGSFTGLRIALATVKMLALSLNVRVIGVPSVAVVAHSAPAGTPHIAVGLNLKRGTMHSQVFQRDGERLVAMNEARLRTIEELLAESPRPVTLIGESLPALPASVSDDAQVTVLSGERAMPRSEVVWHLGRSRARADDFDDPLVLSPLYIREPEAVTLWREQRQT